MCNDTLLAINRLGSASHVLGLWLLGTTYQNAEVSNSMVTHYLTIHKMKQRAVRHHGIGTGISERLAPETEVLGAVANDHCLHPQQLVCRLIPTSSLPTILHGNPAIPSSQSYHKRSPLMACFPCVRARLSLRNFICLVTSMGLGASR